LIVDKNLISLIIKVEHQT